MAIDIADVAGNMLYFSARVDKRTSEWTDLWEEDDDWKYCCRIPRFDVPSYQKAFVKRYAQHITEKGGDLEEFECYLRATFTTGESPYDIDIAQEQFSHQFHVFVNDYDDAFDMYCREERKTLIMLAINWCRENGIEYFDNTREKFMIQHIE